METWALHYMKWDWVVSIVTRLWVQQSRVHSWQGQVIFLLSKMTRPISGTRLVSFPVGTRGSFPTWAGSGQSVWIYLVLKLRMSGAVPLHPVCFWHGPFSFTNFMEHNHEQLAVAQPVWTFPIFFGHGIWRFISSVSTRISHWTISCAQSTFLHLFSLKST